MSGPFPPSLSFPPSVARRRHDSYAELLEDTRGLVREHAAERERWFEGLGIERKDDTLFELEMLLKGLVCFFNPRNHPGLRKGSPLAHDFREEVRIARLGIERILVALRTLLGDRDKRFAFQRYLDSLLVADHDRMRLQSESMKQKSPEESLLVMRQSFASLGDLCDGIGRLTRVPYRQFVALGHLATREISASVYFNPLLQLEFRPEYDRIRSHEVLGVIHGLENEAAQKTVALTFLAHFRLLRYLAAARAILDSRESVGRLYLVLAVFSSDARALGVHVRRDAARAFADGFERQIRAVRAPLVQSSMSMFEAEFVLLRELRGTLESLGSQLRIELRRSFGQLIPAPGASLVEQELLASASGACASLSAFLQHSVVRLAREFHPEAKGERIFESYLSSRAQSERLRKDLWMFAQILRAFVAKATTTQEAADRWAGFTSFQFVREFIQYFRQMGYPLLREGDYARFSEFMRTIAALSDGDLLDVGRLTDATRACEDFYAYLMETFEHVSQREELADVAFDRKDAAETLRLYLST